MFKFLTVLIHIINLLTIAYMIFKEKRSPNNIIAWTLILYIAPFIGFIVFLLVGRKINKSNMFGIKDAEIKILEKYNREVKERTAERVVQDGINVKSKSKTLVYGIITVCAIFA